MTTGIWWSLLSTQWQQQWRLSMVVIAVLFDGDGGGIKPKALMAVLLMVAVDGGSDSWHLYHCSP
jgi:hypothetical protein